MILPDFSKPFWFLILTLIFFIIITGRYFLFAGFFYLTFYVWFPDTWKRRKINSKSYTPGQFTNEVKWSMVTALIFSLAGTATMILWQKGYTKVYTDAELY